MYSTCTFSPVENEGLISYVLEQFPEMELLDMEDYPGFTPGNPQWGNGDTRLLKTRRIFPHHMDGEGHFLALLRKKGTLESAPFAPMPCTLKKEERKLVEEFFPLSLYLLTGMALKHVRLCLPPSLCLHRFLKRLKIPPPWSLSWRVKEKPF